MHGQIRSLKMGRVKCCGCYFAVPRTAVSLPANRSLRPRTMAPDCTVGLSLRLRADQCFNWEPEDKVGDGGGASPLSSLSDTNKVT
jgi:hypothetical protein